MLVLLVLSAEEVGHKLLVSMLVVLHASLLVVVLVLLVRHASLVLVRLRQRKAGQEAVACASSHQTATLAVSPKTHYTPELHSAG